MEASLCRGRFLVSLKYDWFSEDVIRWRCGQLLSRDFIVYKMKPSVRASEVGKHLDIKLWLIFERFHNFGL